MLPLRYTQRWRLAGAMFLLVVLSAALMPAWWFWGDLPRAALFAVDKWLHGITFALLALWFSGQYQRGAYWRIAIGLFAFGILIELCQRAVSYRTAEMADFWADVAGTVAGLVIASLGPGGWSLRFEEWLVARERA